MRSLGFQGGAEAAAKSPGLATARRLIPYLWPKGEAGLKLRVILSLAALAGAKGLGVATPFFFQQAIDQLTAGQALAVVPVALLASYGLARALSLLFGELRDLLFVRVNQHALRRLSLETFAHLHRLSMRYHIERRTGGLTRAIERGSRGIEMMLRFLLFSIFPTIIELALVTAIFGTRFGARYTAILVVSIVVYVTFTWAVTEWRTRFRRDMNAKDREANSRAVDSLLNVETVRVFGNEAHEAAQYDRVLEAYQDSAVQSQLSLSALNAGQSLIINGCLVALMLLSAADMVAGKLTVGELVLVNTLLIQLFIPLNFLGSVFRELKQGLIDMEYMFGLLDTVPEIMDAPDAKALDVNGGAIEFRDVSFAYSPERPILKGVSFTVPAGKTVAIVGPSGAGKSTISRILFRFYDISGGAVLIDGQDIRKVTQQSLRASLGVVPQDTVLFNDSIAYNIAYGRAGSSDDEVKEAARMAQVDTFISTLKDGYAARVGERGLKLSGGEKQRVAIARAILKNPPILLLDEATSALDSETEAAIQESLARIAKTRTTLVIAHRLSTVTQADEILVLDGGRIVERGSHATLLEAGGLYARMWARQREADDVSARLAALKSDPLAAANAARV